MQPPADAQVLQHPLVTLWFDRDGILHKVSKNTPRTLEKVEDLYSFIKQHTKGKKVCAMVEDSNETASDKTVLEYLKREIPHVFTDVAFLSKTSTGDMVAILTSVLVPAHIPTGVFKNETDAKNGLKIISISAPKSSLIHDVHHPLKLLSVILYSVKPV